MSDEKTPGVDPRFDPAFQRGFDPAIPIEEYVPPPSPRKPVVTPTAPRATPVRPRSVVPPPSPPAAAPQPAAVPIAASDDDQDEAEVEQSARGGEVAPSRNPFLLFLGIIAVALVAAGIWLFVRSGEAFDSREVRSQGDYMSLDAAIHSAPFIALLGGATAIGVLFVFAAKYRRHR